MNLKFQQKTSKKLIQLCQRKGQITKKQAIKELGISEEWMDSLLVDEKVKKRITNEEGILNYNTTKLDKYFKYFKTSSLKIAEFTFPLAISYLTGGMGISAAVIPVVNMLAERFRENGINISKGTEKILSDYLVSKSEDALSDFSKHVESDMQEDGNSGKYSLIEIKNIVSLAISEILPEFNDNLFDQLNILHGKSKEELFEMIHEWQEDFRLDQLDFYSNCSISMQDMRSALQKFDNEIESSLSKIEWNIGENYRILNQIMDKILDSKERYESKIAQISNSIF